MTNEQIQRIYNTKMQNLMNKNARREQEQDDADRVAFQKKHEANARTSAKLSLLGMYKDLKESHEMGLVSATYDDPGIEGVLPKKFEKPDPRSFGEMWEDIGTGENIKRGIQNILPGRLGAYRETEGYKEFKETTDTSALDRELEDFQAGLIDGEEIDLPEGGAPTASAGMSDVYTATGDPLGAPDTDATSVVSDDKPGLGRFAGKAFNAANLQTGQQIFNIGKTLTDEDATGEDKAVATVQGTKLLADLAAKHAGQKTASQIGAKAASDYFAKRGLREGVKQTGKQAVGTIAGGALGGYTMVTEGKEAVESWEEKDYDEAILHGIGSAAGGLQTVGAGMMMSVAGAPLGAILYGVGTAASVITSGALFLEGLFGGDGAAPAAPVLPKQRFDASRYINTLRQRERR